MALEAVSTISPRPSNRPEHLPQVLGVGGR